MFDFFINILFTQGGFGGGGSPPQKKWGGLGGREPPQGINKTSFPKIYVFYYIFFFENLQPKPPNIQNKPQNNKKQLKTILYD